MEERPDRGEFVAFAEPEAEHDETGDYEERPNIYEVARAVVVAHHQPDGATVYHHHNLDNGFVAGRVGGADGHLVDAGLGVGVVVGGGAGRLQVGFVAGAVAPLPGEVVGPGASGHFDGPTHRGIGFTALVE